MQRSKRVSANISTHSWDKVKVEDSEFELTDAQKDQLLIDPEEYASGFTHSDKPIKTGKLKASLVDDEVPVEQNTYRPIDKNPADAYLEEEAGLPVTYVESADDEYTDTEFGESEDDESEVAADNEEFSDLGSGDSEFEEFTPAAFDFVADAAGYDTEEEVEAEVEDTFELKPTNDEVAIVDADNIDDTDTELDFATIAKVVHVVKGNRIIASIGHASAIKASVGDVYLTPQFQEVVADTVSRRGLRKGLVASGFVLARTKLTSNKVQATVINAKVKASLTKHISAQAKKDKAMEQSLAIAAVGINRNFFKGASNQLRAALEEELVNAGVRGGSKIVRAMFNKHGVDYAHAILSLANKISAMPEEIRDAYAENFDLVSDEDLSEVEVESDYEEDDMEDFDPEPLSVSASLQNPIRRNVGVLLSATRSSEATAILSGTQSLI
jgi:hypothetical protein